MSMFGAITGTKKPIENDVVGRYPEYDSLARKRYREVVAYLCWERKRLRRIANQVNRLEPEPTLVADQQGWHGTQMPTPEPTLVGGVEESDWLAEQYDAQAAPAPDSGYPPLSFASHTPPMVEDTVAEDPLTEWLAEDDVEAAGNIAEPAASDDPMADWMQEISEAQAADTELPTADSVIATTHEDLIGDTEADLPIHADDVEGIDTEDGNVTLEDLLAYVPGAGGRANGGKHS